MNSQQLAVFSVFMGVMLLCGCEGFRYPASQAQKENAWLHGQVCAAAAERAVEENVSEALCELTSLAHEQSGAFVADYGMPEHPQASLEGATQNVLTPSPLRGTPPLQGESFWPSASREVRDVLSQAKADSLRRPDVFEVADGAIELAIALAGLVGGVYGLRIAGYLKTAREKSKALKEIVTGNELFKQLWPEQAERFKDAQRKQSPATQQIVTQIRAES